jgi:hypothetical protein
MAELHQLPGAMPAPAAPRVIEVNGWDKVDFNDEPPAVIVNPAASASSLADWSRGQLKAVNYLLMELGCSGTSGHECDVPDFVGALRQLLMPVETVLAEAAHRARIAEREARDA